MIGRAFQPSGWKIGLLIASLGLAACVEHFNGYIPVSAVATNGFLKDQERIGDAQGRMIKLWGFVDHGNLYGDAGAKRILQEWWSGEAPRVGYWRFNLKAKAGDVVGHSFPVQIPNDPGRNDLLLKIVADARCGRPTKVFVTGRLLTFKAPTQLTERTGLSLELASSRDIRFDVDRESVALPPTEADTPIAKRKRQST